MSTDFSGIEAQLTEANDAAKLAVSHVEEWNSSKAVEAGSTLSEELDEFLSQHLSRRADEAQANADRLHKQLQRMRIADEQRRLQQQIVDNEEKLRALS